MLLQSIFATTFVGFASAAWVIHTDTSTSYTSFSNTDDLNKFVSSASSALEHVASALSTYQTHLTAQPEYTSQYAALVSYLATRTDVDVEALTATTTTTTYTETPAWYTAMPSEQKKFVESVLAEESKIASSIVSGEAPRPTAMGKYAGAAVAAMAGAGAVFL